MPAFSVHPDLDELARQNIAAALSRPAQADDDDTARSGTADASRHGAHDTRQDARRSSGRARAGRAADAPSSRTYAFRRS
jgi:hypothetical protein